MIFNDPRHAHGRLVNLPGFQVNIVSGRFEHDAQNTQNNMFRHRRTVAQRDIEIDLVLTVGNRLFDGQHFSHPIIPVLERFCRDEADTAILILRKNFKPGRRLHVGIQIVLHPQDRKESFLAGFRHGGEKLLHELLINL